MVLKYGFWKSFGVNLITAMLYGEILKLIPYIGAVVKSTDFPSISEMILLVLLTFPLLAFWKTIGTIEPLITKSKGE